MKRLGSGKYRRIENMKRPAQEIGQKSAQVKYNNTSLDTKPPGSQKTTGKMSNQVRHNSSLFSFPVYRMSKTAYYIVQRA